MSDQEEERPRVGLASVSTIKSPETDKEKAERFRARVHEAARPFIDLLNEASKEGFELTMNLGLDGFGKSFISGIVIIRRL